MSEAARWYMSDFEIRRSWEHADDKREQLKILSQLNLRNKDEVVQKLREIGCDVAVKLNMSGKARHRFTEAEERYIWDRRFMQHEAFATIASRMPGVCTQAAKNMHGIMWKDFTAALPVIRKAMREYAKRGTDQERELIEKVLRRGF